MTVSPSDWTVAVFGAAGGLGLGLGVVIGAAIARALGRFIDPDRRANEDDRPGKGHP